MVSSERSARESSCKGATRPRTEGIVCGLRTSLPGVGSGSDGVVTDCMYSRSAASGREHRNRQAHTDSGRSGDEAGHCGNREVGGGFNPHLLADQSPVNSAVGNLVLPSAFRPINSPTQPGATEWAIDDSFLVSAEVTSEAPFTIRYQLRNEAQWSDGAPIAAEDFRYLWQQMISVPGVVNPAGYQMIDDVNSSGGGKTVNVVMRAPYPAWRELFTDILPSHLIKDTPGGFSTGLSEGIPVSGATFTCGRSTAAGTKSCSNATTDSGASLQTRIR